MSWTGFWFISQASDAMIKSLILFSPCRYQCDGFIMDAMAHPMTGWDGNSPTASCPSPNMGGCCQDQGPADSPGNSGSSLVALCSLDAHPCHHDAVTEEDYAMIQAHDKPSLYCTTWLRPRNSREQRSGLSAPTSLSSKGSLQNQTINLNGCIFSQDWRDL